MDWQFAIVIAAVIVASVYTARGILRQFTRSEDEAAGCHGCAANPATRSGDVGERSPTAIDQLN